MFTGNGKGKTSAAFWTAMRLVLRGERVAVVQFYKEARWPTAEQIMPAVLAGSKSSASRTGRVGALEVYLSGKGFYKLPTDHATPVEHKKAAEAGLAKALELVESRKYAAVVLDEVNNAVVDKLIKVSEVIKVIKERGKTHVILTGRGAHKKVMAMADLVTEMKQVKHPFEKGKKAIKGLDY